MYQSVHVLARTHVMYYSDCRVNYCVRGMGEIKLLGLVADVGLCRSGRADMAVGLYGAFLICRL